MRIFIVASQRKPGASIQNLPLERYTSSGYNFRMPCVSSSIRVKVLFFGRVREITGLTEEKAEVREGTTLADLLERYMRRYPQLVGFRASLVASRNQEFAEWDTRIVDGDEIAFLPPVSGG
jgi:molybdopterin synthase sulfur carrier subunit